MDIIQKANMLRNMLIAYPPDKAHKVGIVKLIGETHYIIWTYKGVFKYLKVGRKKDGKGIMRYAGNYKKLGL